MHLDEPEKQNIDFVDVDFEFDRSVSLDVLLEFISFTSE